MQRDHISVRVDGTPSLRVISQSGKVVVLAEDRDDVLVSGTRVSAEVGADGVVGISGSGSGNIEVRCPAGSCVAIGTSSGSIEVRGDPGDVRATSASGAVTVESARRADLRSETGRVKVGCCGDNCRVQTTSGSVEVERSAATEVSTASGAVTVGRAEGRMRVRTASGRVELGGSGRDDITVQTMSGRVTVKLPPETRPAARLRSMTGREHCELPDGADCLVAVQTMQGAIDVVGME
ncbi:MAG: hypothetical protein C0506_08085 [Anaerolinea sp.]|nr:hypothetical protein [Anaerolinea sp.]